MKARLILGIAGAVLAALGAGWIWGASGQSDMAGALESAELRSELVGARAAVLDARVAIYSVNFGQASSHLENAQGLLGRAEERLKRLGRADQTSQVQSILATIADAQRMTGKLDQSANTRAGDAAKALAGVIDASAVR